MSENITRQEITIDGCDQLEKLEQHFVHHLWSAFVEKVGVEPHWFFCGSAVHRLMKEHEEVLNHNDVQILLHPNLSPNQLIITVTNPDQEDDSQKMPND